MFCREFGVNYSTSYKEIPRKIQAVLMYGTEAKGDQGTGLTFEGVIPNLKRRFETTESEWVKQRLHGYMSEQPCETCGGKRLKKEALAVRLHTLEETGVVASQDAPARPSPGAGCSSESGQARREGGARGG